MKSVGNASGPRWPRRAIDSARADRLSLTVGVDEATLAAREPAGNAHAHALSSAYSSAIRRATSMLSYRSWKG